MLSLPQLFAYNKWSFLVRVHSNRSLRRKSSASPPLTRRPAPKTFTPDPRSRVYRIFKESIRKHYTTRFHQDPTIQLKPLADAGVREFLVRTIAAEIQVQFKVVFDVVTYVTLVSSLINLISSIYLTVQLHKENGKLRVASAINLASSITTFLGSVGQLIRTILEKCARRRASAEVKHYDESVRTLSNAFSTDEGATFFLSQLVNIINTGAKGLVDDVRAAYVAQPPASSSYTPTTSSPNLGVPPRITTAATTTTTTSTSVQSSVTPPATTVTPSSGGNPPPPVTSVPVTSSNFNPVTCTGPTVTSASTPATTVTVGGVPPVSSNNSNDGSDGGLNTGPSVFALKLNLTQFRAELPNLGPDGSSQNPDFADTVHALTHFYNIGRKHDKVTNASCANMAQAYADCLMDKMRRLPGHQNSTNYHTLSIRLALILDVMDFFAPTKHPHYARVAFGLTRNVDDTGTQTLEFDLPDGNNPVTKVCFHKQASSMKYTSASGYNNECLADSLAHLTHSTVDQIFALPRYSAVGSVGPAFVRGQMQDEDMIRSVCMATGRNAVVVDDNGNAIYACIVNKKATEKKQFLYLMLKGYHYHYLNHCAAQTKFHHHPQTYVVEAYPDSMVNLRGGSDFDIPALVRGVSALALTCAVGAAEANNVPLSSIKNVVSIFNAGATFSGNASAFSKYICETLFDMDFTSDGGLSRIISNLTAYGTTLLSLTAVHLAEYPELGTHMEDYVRQCQAVTARGSKDKTINMQLMNLRSVVSKVMDKIPILKATARQKARRPPTLLYHFYGAPGSGKSHMSTDIIKEMAKEFKTSDNPYTFRKSGDHYPTYGGEKFGLYDEFLYRGKSDPIIHDLTCISSETPFPIPAAFEKEQHCQLWALFMCSNCALVPLDGVLTNEGIAALKSRINTYRMDIDLPTGVAMTPANRGDPKIIPRYDDYRNVSITHETFDISGSPISCKLTYAQLVTKIKDEVKANIARFPPPIDRQELQNLQYQYHRMKLDTEKILITMDPPVMENKAGEDMGCNTQHVCAMLSGESGTGKSQTIYKVIPILQAAFPHMDVTVFTSRPQMDAYCKSDPKTRKRGIYYFDDLLVNFEDVVQATVNTIPAPSIIVHTANVQLHKGFNLQRKSSKLFRNFCAKVAHRPQGFDRETKIQGRIFDTTFEREGAIRRSGMAGYFRTISGEVVYVPDNFNVWFLTTPRRSCQNSALQDAIEKKRHVLPITFANDIIRKFATVCHSSGAITYRACATHLTGDFDVDIKMPHIEELAKFCGNLKDYKDKMVWARETLRKKRDTEPIVVFIDKDLSIKLCDAIPASFVLKNRTPEELKSLIAHFITGVWEADPKARCRIEIGSDIVYAEHNTIYMPTGYAITEKVEGDTITISQADVTFSYNRKHFCDVLTAGVTHEPLASELFLLTNKDDIMRLPEVSGILQAYVLKGEQIKARRSYLARVNAQWLRVKTSKAFKVVAIIVGVIVGALAIGSIAYGIYKLATRKSDEEETSEEPSETPPSETPLKELEQGKRSSQAERVKGLFQAPRYTSRNWTIAESPVGRNVHYNADYYTTRVAKVKGLSVSCHGMVMDNETVITVAHVVDKQRPTALVIDYEDVLYTAKSVIYNESHDLAIVKLARTVQRDLPPLWKHLANHEVLDSLSDTTMCLGSARYEVPFPYYESSGIRVVAGTTRLVKDTLTSGPQKETIVKDGDCGYPLVATDPNDKCSTRLVGIVRATLPFDNSVAFAALSREIFQEHHPRSIMNATVQFPAAVFLPTDAELLDTKGISTMELQGVHYHGRVSTGFVPVKDKVCPSPFRAYFPEMPVTKAPTKETYLQESGPYHKLRATRFGDICYAQMPTLIAKQAPRVTNIEDRFMEKTFDYLSHRYEDIYGRITTKLSDRETLSGIRKNDHRPLGGFLGPLNLKSGAGILQSLMKCPMKSDLIKCDEHGNYHWRENEAAQVTCARIRQVEQRLLLGQHTNLLSMDSLKSELIDTAKAAKGKIRLFQAAPIEEVVLARKYFGAFMATAAKFHHKAHAQIGLVPETDFDVLAKRLLQTSAIGEDGDFSNYDKSLPAQLMQAACALINSIHDDGFSDARTALMYSIVTSTHCAKGHVYSTLGGNPSGNALTTLINCVCNDILQVYCYFVAQADNPGLPENPTDAIDWITCGDDSLTVIRPEYGRFYNGFVKSQIILKHFAMEYTPAQKVDDISSDLKPLQELSFCSRRFTKLASKPEIWAGLLKKDTICSFVQWCSDPSPVHLASLVDCLLLELAPHDRSFVDYILDGLWRIREDMPPVGVRVHFPMDFDGLRQQYYERHGISADHALAEGLISKALPSIPTSLEGKEACHRHVYRCFHKNQEVNTTLNIDARNIPEFVERDPSSAFQLAVTLANRMELEITYEYSDEGPAHNKTWTCVASLKDHHVTAKGFSKAAAKKSATSKLLTFLCTAQRPALSQADVHLLYEQRAIIYLAYQGNVCEVKIVGRKTRVQARGEVCEGDSKYNLATRGDSARPEHVIQLALKQFADRVGTASYRSRDEDPDYSDLNSGTLDVDKVPVRTINDLLNSEEVLEVNSSRKLEIDVEQKVFPPSKSALRGGGKRPTTLRRQVPCGETTINEPPAQIVMQSNQPVASAPLTTPMGGVPQVGMVTAGIHGDLKEKAYSIWNIVNAITVDSTLDYGAKIMSWGFTPDSVSGYAQSWISQHDIIGGTILHRVAVVAQPAMMGSFVLAQVTEDKDLYSFAELSAISYSVFTARDIQTYETKSRFYDQTRSYLHTSEFNDSASKYWWVLCAGHPIQGLVSTTDSVPTIGLSLYCILGPDFICQNATVPITTDTAITTVGNNTYVGKTFSDLLGGLKNIKFAIDGKNYLLDPFIKGEAHHVDFPPLLYTVQGTTAPTSSRFSMTSFLSLSKKALQGSPTLYSPAGPGGGRTQTYGARINDYDTCNPWFEDSDNFYVLVGTPIAGNMTGDDYAYWEKPDDLEPVDSGVCSGTIVWAVGDGSSLPSYDFSNAPFEHYISGDNDEFETYLISFPKSAETTDVFTATPYYYINQLSPDDGDVSIGGTNLFTLPVESFTLTSVQLTSTNQVFANYPVPGMYRVGITTTFVPTVTSDDVSNNATTIYYRKDVRDALDALRSTIVEGKDLEIEFRDSVFNHTLCRFRISSDVTCAPYVIMNSATSGYLTLPTEVDNCIVSSAQLVTAGTMTKAQYTTPFASRIISSGILGNTREESPASLSSLRPARRLIFRNAPAQQ